jgi:3,5-epimerase/4-reductase
MKICTVGTGFISAHLGYNHINSRVDLSIKQIENLLDNHKPDVLINCIGKIGRPNVDWCESNKEITATTNIALPILLAEVCAKKSIHLIQIGSGCIYFGESPNTQWIVPPTIPNAEPVKVDFGWRENDFANPKSYYSKSKYACDLALGGMNSVTVLRIRMPISTHDNPRNLINKLRGYQQVIDIPNSVTFIDDLVKCVDWVIKTSQIGIFNVTNPQPLTAAMIMREYQKYIPSHTFSIIDEQQLDNLVIAKRSNCILNTDKLQRAGFYMTPSKKALTDCMKKYIKNLETTCQTKM